MNNNREERLLSVFREAAGAKSGNGAAEAPVSAGETSRRTEEAQATSFDASQDSGPGDSYHGTSGSSSSTSAGSSGGALESAASSLFGGALGLIPLVGSLFGLFGDNSKSQPVFQKYEMPPPIDFEAAVTPDGGLTNASYGQMGLPRVYDSGASPGASAAAPVSANNGPASGSGSAAAQDAASSNGGTPQISVNVQAMDAQSFMSYSGEIAKAVRDAMLNLSSLNDVVTDL